ncbi:DUF5988 family protein [Streptomyces sp. 3N207]|uniref:DUF5988 family protein n=1 Tax=Streptomyces sp. 3N207 TaxID=3457417 RepID=UPI003FD5ABB7
METYVQVILEGGPDDIPRIREVPRGNDIPQVKVLRGNGYEHYQLTQGYEEYDGQLLPVYQWCYRTFIAE